MIKTQSQLRTPPEERDQTLHNQEFNELLKDLREYDISIDFGTYSYTIKDIDNYGPFTNTDRNSQA